MRVEVVRKKIEEEIEGIYRLDTMRTLETKRSQPKILSLVDDGDGSFPENDVSLTLPIYMKDFYDVCILGISHGLFCFYGYMKGMRMAVFWNPSIKKSVDIVVPDEIRTVVGFGVCPRTSDPKLVSIPDNLWQVEVFTLSSEAWRSITTNSSLKQIRSITWNQVAIDGCIYWHAHDLDFVNGRRVYQDVILSFDLTSEEFITIKLPDCV
ncbi:putative F-box protein At1g47730 [Rutidosis leptorrhynchoides]|uniref:putative F-box protein At1g47730 n=1 Tax=Rutidosis leptorrhynchoides TaxID=125765 RepID=UPI003A99D848